MTSHGPDPAAAPAVSVTVGVDLGGTGTRVVALDQAGSVRSALSTATRRGPACRQAG